MHNFLENSDLSADDYKIQPLTVFQSTTTVEYALRALSEGEIFSVPVLARFGTLTLPVGDFLELKTNVRTCALLMPHYAVGLIPNVSF
jgi:hypothetical protein